MTTPGDTQINPSPNGTAELWKKFRGSALKRGLFSAGFCIKAPYFRTVLPRIREAVPGRAVVRIGNWWGIRNHIGTYHVIAALNGAEAAMGILCEVSVPTTHRWIPRGMRADYPTKSTGGLTVTATADFPDFAQVTRETGGQLVTVDIQLLDDAGNEPVHAEIDVWVSAKKKCPATARCSRRR
ncbi:MAG TPA: thioesterase [Corynebacterium nuruki]|uniref:Thioesterase n=2 Tax=Corynebacterium nuruki TaxID=1032851 RepID=A0A3D4T1R2_9CORY|nr:thioesterase [Corynebacterium nuruki]